MQDMDPICTSHPAKERPHHLQTSWPHSSFYSNDRNSTSVQKFIQIQIFYIYSVQMKRPKKEMLNDVVKEFKLMLDSGEINAQKNKIY